MTPIAILIEVCTLISWSGTFYDVHVLKSFFLFVNSHTFLLPPRYYRLLRLLLVCK